MASELSKLIEEELAKVEGGSNGKPTPTVKPSKAPKKEEHQKLLKKPQGSGGSGSRVKEAHKPEKTIYDEPEPAWSKFWASYKHIIIGAAIVVLLLLWLLAVLHSRSVALPQSTGEVVAAHKKHAAKETVSETVDALKEPASDTGLESEVALEAEDSKEKGAAEVEEPEPTKPTKHVHAEEAEPKKEAAAEVEPTGEAAVKEEASEEEVPAKETVPAPEHAAKTAKKGKDGKPRKFFKFPHVKRNKTAGATEEAEPHKVTPKKAKAPAKPAVELEEDASLLAPSQEAASALAPSQATTAVLTPTESPEAALGPASAPAASRTAKPVAIAATKSIITPKEESQLKADESEIVAAEKKEEAAEVAEDVAKSDAAAEKAEEAQDAAIEEKEKAELALEKDEKLIEKEGKTKILAAIEAIANGAPASAPVAAILTGAEKSVLVNDTKVVETAEQQLDEKVKVAKDAAYEGDASKAAEAAKAADGAEVKADAAEEKLESDKAKVEGEVKEELVKEIKEAAAEGDPAAAGKPAGSP